MTKRKRRANLLRWAAEAGVNGIHEAIVSTLAGAPGDNQLYTPNEAENGVKKAEKANDSAGSAARVPPKKDVRDASGDETDGKSQ